MTRDPSVARKSSGDRNLIVRVWLAADTARIVLRLSLAPLLAGPSIWTPSTAIERSETADYPGTHMFRPEVRLS